MQNILVAMYTILLSFYFCYLPITFAQNVFVTFANNILLIKIEDK